MYSFGMSKGQADTSFSIQVWTSSVHDVPTAPTGTGVRKCFGTGTIEYLRAEVAMAHQKKLDKAKEKTWERLVPEQRV